jgi:hypothetical protein
LFYADLKVAQSRKRKYLRPIAVEILAPLIPLPKGRETGYIKT